MKDLVKRTDAFADWLADLRDRQAVAAIAKRLVRASNGHLGDIKHAQTLASGLED